MASTMRFDRWEDPLGNSVNMTQVSGGSGLVPVVPTSIAVSGGTVTNNDIGKVNFSAGTTQLTLNGIFSSKFTNYRIILNATSGGNINIAARLAAGGTPNSSNGYSYHGWVAYSAGTLVSSNSINNTSFDLGIPSTNGYLSVLDISRPNVVSPTNFTQSYGSSEYSGGRGGTFTVSASFDGIQLLPQAAVSGEIIVYGYRDK